MSAFRNIFPIKSVAGRWLSRLTKASSNLGSCCGWWLANCYQLKCELIVRLAGIFQLRSCKKITAPLTWDQ